MNGFGHQAKRDKRQQRRQLEKTIEGKQRLKEKARNDGRESAWFGLGMFGLVGWSVAIPSLLGIAVGVWIDARWPSQFSWTLMLLVGGIVLGCMNAWRWVAREMEPRNRTPPSAG